MQKTVGLNPRSLHPTDGSGLSASNRVAPEALAKALMFAKSRPWFSGFLNSFPIYNGMTIKSGTINLVKCFAGYHNNYIVAIMVNNYNGSTTAITNKMFTVLNGLK